MSYRCVLNRVWHTVRLCTPYPFLQMQLSAHAFLPLSSNFTREKWISTNSFVRIVCEANRLAACWMQTLFSSSWWYHWNSDLQKNKTTIWKVIYKTRKRFSNDGIASTHCNMVKPTSFGYCARLSDEYRKKPPTNCLYFVSPWHSRHSLHRYSASSPPSSS